MQRYTQHEDIISVVTMLGMGPMVVRVVILLVLGLLGSATNHIYMVMNNSFSGFQCM